MPSTSALGFHCSHEQVLPSTALRLTTRAAEAGFTAAMCSDHFHPWSERQGHSGLVLRAAADAPLEVIRLSAAGLKRARTVAAYSCRAARNDVELAIALLRVGLSGARANLEGKLSSLTDAEYTRAVVEEVAHLGEGR